MTIPWRNIAWPLLAVTLLAGCGTTPQSHYYLLTAAEAPLPSGESPSLGIGPISLSAYLNRNALVRRSGSNQLELSNTTRWGEPLEDGVSRVLGLNLAGLLQTKSVVRYPWHPARAPQYGIKVHVLEMDATADSATLVVEWLVYRPGDASAIARQLSRQSSPFPGPETDSNTLASLYSDMLLALSEDIAATIRAQDAQRPADTAE